MAHFGYPGLQPECGVAVVASPLIIGMSSSASASLSGVSFFDFIAFCFASGCSSVAAAGRLFGLAFDVSFPFLAGALDSLSFCCLLRFLGCFLLLGICLGFLLHGLHRPFGSWSCIERSRRDLVGDRLRALNVQFASLLKHAAEDKQKHRSRDMSVVGCVSVRFRPSV